MSRFTVLVTANAFRESAGTAEAPLRAADGAVCYPPRMGPLTAGELVPALAAADAVIASTDPYTDDVLAACPRLRVLVRWGTGYDSVDLAACTRHGVVACNTPGLNVNAVADHAMLLMLGSARHIARQVAVMRGGSWEEVRGTELYGKTVGLVGCGAIGRAVARRLRGFECRVLAFDPLLDPESATALAVELAPLERLLAEADVVSLHAALTPESRGLIGATELRRMKPTAILINTARGPLVDEDALVRALTEGWIAGAGLDAYADEPLRPDHPLRHLPNCLATPHCAFNTVEAAEATNRAVAETLLAVLRGGCPENVLNPGVFASPRLRAKAALLPG